VSRVRGGVSAAFATGLAMLGVGKVSGTLPAIAGTSVVAGTNAVAGTSAVAVAPEADSSFALLLELAGCMADADSAG
jgi:hypothetical protein